jgi:hypothetical protein
MARQTEVTELLRRLPIILLEDTFLHAAIVSRWVWWCLASSRGWVLSEDAWQRLLLDVAFIADTDAWSHRERLGKTDATQSPSALFEATTETYTELQKAALFALWARSQWGGMLGDMAFLRALFATWRARDPKGTLWRIATTTDPCEESLIVLAPLDSLDFSVEEHGLPEAVDFHCVPNMLFSIAQRIGATKAGVQAAIWYCRSGVNVRTYIDGPQRDTEPHASLRDMLAHIDFEPFVQAAWAPRDPPVSRQGTLFRFFPGALSQPPLPPTPPPPQPREPQRVCRNPTLKDRLPKRTQSALPWISRH